MTASSGTSIANRRTRFLFSATIAGIVLYVILDAVAQSLPPHYSLVSQAESDLAVGPYGYVMAINFVNRGVFSLLFLLGLANALPARREYRRGFLLFGIWAVGAMVLAAAPADVTPPATLHGVVHLLVAVLAFLGGAFGALTLSRGFSNDTSLKMGLLMPLAVLAVTSLVILYGATAVPRFDARYGGLLERVFLGLVLAWMLASSAAMLKREGIKSRSSRPRIDGRGERQ
ncbi:MAG: DUF998 domain-containing protein [Thaumarchaeota archaeon]|nr:DUF998 domain-containing protein [Nitrososphaerota archaeon]